MPVDLSTMAAELAVLALLVSIVVALAIYRHLVARSEDLHLHVSANEVPLAGKQMEISARLAQIDRWGKILTVVAAIYFLILLGRILYMGWQATASMAFTD